MQLHLHIETKRYENEALDSIVPSAFLRGLTVSALLDAILWSGAS